MNHLTFPWDTDPDQITINNTSPLTVEDGAGNVKESDTNLINFDNSLNVTKTSDGEVKVDVDGSAFQDTRVDVSDSGANSVTNTSLINFSSGLNYTVQNGDEIVVNAVGGKTFFQVPLSDVGDGEQVIGVRFRIPDGETYEFSSAGVQNDSGNVPVGLNIQLYDETNNQLLIDENSIFASGSPLASVSGPLDVSIRVVNTTGSFQIASGHMIMGTGSGGASGGDTRTDVSDINGLVESDVTNIKYTASQNSNAQGFLNTDVTSSGTGAIVDYYIDGINDAVDAWAIKNNLDNTKSKYTNINSVTKVTRGVFRVQLSGSIWGGNDTAPLIDFNVSPYKGWESDESTNNSGFSIYNWEQDPDSNGSSDLVEVRFKNPSGDLVDPFVFSISVINIS